MPIDAYLGFFGVTLLLALSPGPDNAYLLTLSAEQGFRRGLLLTAGLCSGLVLHTLLAVSGLSALLAASPTAFALLSMAGALYLIWLALGMWKTAAPASVTQQPVTGLALYRRGLLMNLSNPKVVVFFVALLPQFATGPDTSTQTLITLGAILVLGTLLVFGSLAALGNVLLHWQHWAPLQRWLNRLTALAIVLAALALLYSLIAQ